MMEKIAMYMLQEMLLCLGILRYLLGFILMMLIQLRFRKTPVMDHSGYYYIRVDGANGKDIHGGGNTTNTALVSNPYADYQGWVRTYGCTRMQNAGVNDLAMKILSFKDVNPGVQVPFDVVGRRSDEGF